MTFLTHSIAPTALQQFRNVSKPQSAVMEFRYDVMKELLVFVMNR
jgi:hypothetical protein